MEFLYALAAIVVIDIVLAGDNAIVIALAARNIPRHLQRRAIMWGTVGAVAVRTLLTVVVVWLLKIPGLLLAGGALLLWIAYRLLDDGEESEHSVAPAASFWGAMKTIVVADVVMGLDNVLAVAGAAQGSFLLVVLGLLISIPIVVWGSTLILHLVERHPVIIYFGAGVLAWTAAKMMASEPLVKPHLVGWETLVTAVQWAIVVGLIGLSLAGNRRKARSRGKLPVEDVSKSSVTPEASA
jgi:YjbE family integral membrane protein